MASTSQSQAASTKASKEKTSTTNEKPSKLAATERPLPQLPPVQPKKPSVSTSEAFAESLLRKATASVIEHSGFAICEGGALTALSNVCKAKINSLGLELKYKAESSQRKLVTVEDFAACVPAFNEMLTEADQPLRLITGVPSFPQDPPILKRIDAKEQTEELKRMSGLAHFPPLPPDHTYKRSKVEQPELSTAEVADLRQTQQKNSVLVRESLAKMRESLST